VASLLKADSTSRIFCLNRSDDKGERTRSALSSICPIAAPELDRLRFFRAELARPDFGLSAEIVAQLKWETTELIFNAWDPNWSKPLSYFRSFLAGISNSIDFCVAAERHPRITFISSVCAVGDWPLANPTNPDIPEDIVWNHLSTMSSGYAESKCIAEQLLGLACEISEVPVNIVRAGQIGGRSDSSPGSWPRQGWLYSIISTSHDIGSFPDHVQPLDWIPVDCLAQGVVNCTKLNAGFQNVRVFNMVHPHPVAWNMLYKALQDHCGLVADLKDLSAWLDQSDSKLHDFLKANKDGREFNMKFSNSAALQVLPRVHQMTPGLLSAWLRDWDLPCRLLRARL